MRSTSYSGNMYSILSFLLCFITVLLSSQRAFSFLDSTVCYKDINCFSSGPPFKSATRPISVTPSSPEHIRTQFVLYTRDNPKQPQKLYALDFRHAKTKWTHFQNRQTQFIIHGWLDDYNIITWFKKLKDLLLGHGDYNTIIVDWHHGNLPPYAQGTANTRVVGAQIALLVNQLQKDFNMSASQFHAIGHSLGAHVAGYAGERVPGFGRITGLDPAGPYYEGTDKVVRLDATDADFVDVIHSDGYRGVLQIGLGMLEPSGDADFYPNLGHDQPGCKPEVIKSLTNLGLANGLEEIIGCNHLRSAWYFLESINTKCPFKAFPCTSAEDFKANRCLKCPAGGCPSMGFHADKNKPPPGTMKQYYLTTSDSSPYCEYHVDIKLRMSTTSASTEERGRVRIRFRGSKGTSRWLHFDKQAYTYIPGSSYEQSFGVPSDLGSLVAVEFKWHHNAPLTNPLKWNLFGWRHPVLVVHEIDIIMEEQGNEVHFCADDASVETDHYIIVHKRC